MDIKSSHHLRGLVRQGLNEFGIDPHQWEDVLVDVGNAVASDVPFVAELVKQTKTHFSVSIVHEITGEATDSHYIPGYQGELCGAVKLHCSMQDFEFLGQIIELVVYYATHSQLETRLYKEHGIERIHLHHAHLNRNQRKMAQWLNWFGRHKPLPPEKEPNYQSLGRVESTLSKMERTILSVSPQIHFPPPFLLLRLSQDDQINNGNMHISSGISVDSRASLNYLNISLNFASILKHQSISFSYSVTCDSRQCHLPKILTVEYYSKSGPFQDRTLGQYINLLCSNAEAACSDQCQRPMSDHVISYIHGKGRVTVVLRKTNEVEAEIDARQIYCKATHGKEAMSQLSLMHSFGKYLELLFYDKIFQEKPLVYYHAGFEVEIAHETIDLFEMRVSKYQVNTEGEYEHSFFYESVSGLRQSMDSFGEIRRDISLFYQGLRNHLTKLLQSDGNDGREHEMIEDLVKNSYIEEASLYDQFASADPLHANNFRLKTEDTIKRHKESVEAWIKEFKKEPIYSWDFPEFMGYSSF